MFLIQTPIHDFSFTLIEAIKYQAWIGNSMPYCLSKTMKENCIPIGSVEFVVQYLERFFHKSPKPINLPLELFPYAGRNIFNGHSSEIHGRFSKSNDRIKDPNPCPESCQISDWIPIESEWRAFVYKGNLVGLQNYQGDFTLFPDVHRIHQMIRDFPGPVAYTLDVAMPGTLPIEVHDFFSVGLYGFADFRILPFMYSRWFFEYTQSHSLMP